MRVELLVANGVHQGQIISLRYSQFLIGRDRVCNLRPQDDYVSKRHCAVLVRGERVFLRDLRSTNGTFLNGMPILGQVELHDEDMVQVGSLSFFVQMQPMRSPAKLQPDEAEALVARMLLAMENEATVAMTKKIRQDAPEEIPTGPRMLEPKSWETNAQDSANAARALLSKFQRRPGS